MGRLAGWRRDHPLALRSLAAWGVLLPVALRVESSDDPLAVTASAVLSPLAGAFGSVVIGALFVDRWKIAQVRKEKLAWVRHNASVILQEHELARALLATAAIAAYKPVAGFFDPIDRVSQPVLRWDIEAEPVGESDPVGQLDEVMRKQINGPLTYVHQQVAALARAAHWADQRQRMAALAIEPEQQEDDLLLVYRDGWARLKASAVGAGYDVHAACAEAASILRDLGVLEAYRPLREVNAEASSPGESGVTGTSMLNAARELRIAGEHYARAVVLLHEPASASAKDTERGLMIKVLQATENVLVAAMSARKELTSLARSTAERITDLDRDDAAFGPALRALRTRNDEIRRQRATSAEAEWHKFTSERKAPRAVPPDGTF